MAHAKVIIDYNGNVMGFIGPRGEEIGYSTELDPLTRIVDVELLEYVVSAAREIINSDVIKQLPFASYSEAIYNLRLALENLDRVEK